MNGNALTYLDALHGEVTLDARIAELVATPVVQRLRHVRLSNIDSVSMPGIANLSRYEHVLGVAHLASRLGFRARLTAVDHLALMAAALLHDWAITAFGHLVEEAFNYLSLDFDHERKLDSLLHGNRDGDTLGAELQIIAGRQTRLPDWARAAVGPGQADALLARIGELIRGRGSLGRIVCGDIDLDNIDNVCRMAFHMGLLVERDLPRRLAEAVMAVDDAGPLVFAKSAAADVEAWVETRRAVYSRLMPARPDFSFKVMIIWATTRLVELGELTRNDWTLTDADLVQRLSSSSDRTVIETAERWKAGEAWSITPLWWLEGQRPSYPELAKLSAELTTQIGRPCFAYGIKDKRERRLDFAFDDGSRASFGSEPRAWLFGVGSSRRAPFSRAETERLIAIATAKFAPAEHPAQADNPMAASQEPVLL